MGGLEGVARGWLAGLAPYWGKEVVHQGQGQPGGGAMGQLG